MPVGSNDQHGNGVTQAAYDRLERSVVIAIAALRELESAIRAVTPVAAPVPVIEPKPDARPRGVRNNNPGNVERNSIQWKGMAVEQDDGRFIKFTKPEWGFRCMARILKGDWREGQNTVESLIGEWAPPTENQTATYVNFVAKALGVAPGEPIDVPARLPALCKAIARFEQGYDAWPDEIIQLGIDMEASA